VQIAIVHTPGTPCTCADAMATGFRALGHVVELFDGDRILLDRSRIAAADLVVEHTVSLAGRAPLRPYVRFLLEAAGARLVGTPAAAALRVDDKAATTALLAAAGVPVPEAVPFPSPPPLVFKPVFEHCSRGLFFYDGGIDAAAAGRRLAALQDEYGQPVLVERFVAGRELAVAVLADGDGRLAPLPPLEYRLGGAVLDEAAKRDEASEDRDDLVAVELTPALERWALRACEALGLRDYGRFDVRVAEDGTAYFLEANGAPSMERGEAFALAARAAGLSYEAMLARLLGAAARRYGRAASCGDS